MKRYINGSENEAFGSSQDQGVDFYAMHLRRPELPSLNGVVQEPPSRFRAVFDFHLSNWNKTYEQIAAVSDSERRRIKVLRDSGRTNFTDEAIAEAKALIMASPKYSPAEIRARNYYRCHFPNSHDET